MCFIIFCRTWKMWSNQSILRLYDLSVIETQYFDISYLWCWWDIHATYSEDIQDWPIPVIHTASKPCWLFHSKKATYPQTFEFPQRPLCELKPSMIYRGWDRELESKRVVIATAVIEQESRLQKLFLWCVAYSLGEGEGDGKDQSTLSGVRHQSYHHWGIQSRKQNIFRLRQQRLPELSPCQEKIML